MEARGAAAAASRGGGGGALAPRGGLGGRERTALAQRRGSPRRADLGGARPKSRSRRRPQEPESLGRGRRRRRRRWRQGRKRHPIRHSRRAGGARGGGGFRGPTRRIGTGSRAAPPLAPAHTPARAARKLRGLDHHPCFDCCCCWLQRMNATSGAAAAASAAAAPALLLLLLLPYA